MAVNGKHLLRVVFAGTPDFAVPSLAALIADPYCEIQAVYTQPDRGAGRGRRAKPSPVKRAAEAAGLRVVQPNDFRNADTVEEFRAFAADLFVVAAYGLLLPQAVLDGAGLALNVHASLLPRWRGAAPIQRAIMAGDRETGISMMRMVEKLDAGPVLLQEALPLASDATGGSTHDLLASLGADCLQRVIEQIRTGTVHEQAQNEAAVTYAKKITATDRALDLSAPAVELARTVRALNPTPVATLGLGEARVKVWEASAISTAAAARPGTLLAAGADGIDIATGNGALRIGVLQAEGKRPLPATDFLNGSRHLLDALETA